MNSHEKKALFRFVTIYTLSSFILVAIIAYLYYDKEIQRQKQTCKVDLKNCVIKVESALLKAKLYENNFVLNPLDFRSGVGLYDEERKEVHTSLSYHDIKFDVKMTKNPLYIHLVHKLEKPLLGIHYIVTEDTSMPIVKDKLLSLIIIVILFCFIFIAIIGYFLSRLLLKPVKEKIDYIDKFIKDSAHEINTPIASLLMSVSALKKKGIADPKILNHISISSKQISDVYNSLSHLAFDDIDVEKNLSQIDFKEYVLRSVEFYTQIAKSKRIHIESHLEETLIMIDKDDAKKLINNLLSNAVKYSKTDTVIQLLLKNNILTVKDEGIGIDTKQKKEILRRYHRGTHLQGGFGIGLDIVNSLSHYYNIPLDIQSTKGVGSTFSLDFTTITHIA